MIPFVERREPYNPNYQSDLVNDHFVEDFYGVVGYGYSPAPTPPAQAEISPGTRPAAMQIAFFTERWRWAEDRFLPTPGIGKVEQHEPLASQTGGGLLDWIERRNFIPPKSNSYSDAVDVATGVH